MASPQPRKLILLQKEKKKKRTLRQTAARARDKWSRLCASPTSRSLHTVGMKAVSGERIAA
jgi:hypothetical protein